MWYYGIYSAGSLGWSLHSAIGLGSRVAGEMVRKFFKAKNKIRAVEKIGNEMNSLKLG